MTKNRRLGIGLAIGIILGTGTLIQAQVSLWEDQIKEDPGNTELLLKLGQYYHDLGGNQQDKGAVKKSVQNLERLLDLEPKNSVAMVYYGSALTMRARDVFFPWEKMKYMKKGIGRMDKAVTLDPENREVRLIRGINNSQLPDMFQKLSPALEDFETIEKWLSRSAQSEGDAFLLPFYYHYGCALLKTHKETEARKQFEMVVKINPESEYGNKAQKRLEEMEVL